MQGTLSSTSSHPNLQTINENETYAIPHLPMTPSPPLSRSLPLSRTLPLPRTPPRFPARDTHTTTLVFLPQRPQPPTHTLTPLSSMYHSSFSAPVATKRAGAEGRGGGTPCVEGCKGCSRTLAWQGCHPSPHPTPTLALALALALPLTRVVALTSTCVARDGCTYYGAPA